MILLSEASAEAEMSLILIYVSVTHIYHQKSDNHTFQRKSYPLHKSRNLFKPMMLVAPDGYIIDVHWSFSVRDSDATMLDAHEQIDGARFIQIIFQKRRQFCS